MRLTAFLVSASMAALALPAHAEVDYSLTLDAQAVQNIVVYLEHKDCKGAVKALNKGIADKQRAALLMAGSMYEQGLCLKADWDQAAHYYQRAHEAGSRAAMPRLISGYAEKNRDPAAALWWMAKSRYAMPAVCASANHLAADPDAFVAALNTWPAGQVNACVYTAGVLTRLDGEVEFPGAAASHGVSGDAIMDFYPATATIKWSKGDTERIAVTRMVRAGSDETSVFNDIFLAHVRSVGDRTLAQFTRPEGIDPAWHISMKFQFRYE